MSVVLNKIKINKIKYQKKCEGIFSRPLYAFCTVVVCALAICFTTLQAQIEQTEQTEHSEMDAPPKLPDGYERGEMPDPFDEPDFPEMPNDYEQANSPENGEAPEDEMLDDYERIEYPEDEMLNECERSEMLDIIKMLDDYERDEMPAPLDEADPIEQLITAKNSPLAAHERRFLNAVLAGDFSSLKDYLEQGGNPNIATTATIPANIVALYPTISKKFSFFLCRDIGVTPLMAAAAYDNPEVARTLLDAGAKRWSRTKRNRFTSLEIGMSHPDIIRILFDSPPEAVSRRIVLTLAKQQGILYEDGEPVFTFSICSGKRSTPTPKGTFYVTQRDRHHRSNLYNNAPMPYFLRLSQQAFGLHQGVMMRRPASHGCIRLSNASARTLWEKIPLGTEVTIE